MRCNRKLVATSWLMLTASCATPTLRVEAHPARSEVFVDARYRGRDTLDAPLPYYGTIDIWVAPPTDPGQSLLDTRTELRVDEPVSPWLYPFDFLIEVTAAAIGYTTDETTVSVTAATRTEVVIPGRVPPVVEGLRARAATMEVQR